MTEVFQDAPKPKPKPKVNPRGNWNIKGLPAERREAITVFAHNIHESVAEFIWVACSARMDAMRQESMPKAEMMQSGSWATHTPIAGPALDMGQVVDMICKVAGTEPTKGNGLMLARTRQALLGHLQLLAPQLIIAPTESASPRNDEQLTETC